ncbi:MAG: hypothetical protein AAF127_11520 [Pseudomonadota bacterium]
MSGPSFEWAQNRRLSEFIDIGLIGEPNQSIADLSGNHDRLGPEDFRTSLIEFVDETWHLPLHEWTCEHFRTLVEQRMALEWIAETIAEFVDLHARIMITNYEGEVSILALKALDDIQKVNPVAASRLRSLDYSWMCDEFAYNKDLQREAVVTLKRISN